MNSDTLNGFLLATAQDPWDQWWGMTRLIFADWLEENDQPDKAQALREMTCEVADEMDKKDRLVARWSVSAPNAVTSCLVPLRLESYFYEWETLSEVVVNLREGFRQTLPELAISNRVRVSCLGGLVNESVNYTVGFTAELEEPGRWHGTLSLDRAQRRCRWRVLEMFSPITDEPTEHHIFNRSVLLAYSALVHADDSPRWVPFAPQPEPRYNPRRATLHFG